MILARRTLFAAGLSLLPLGRALAQSTGAASAANGDPRMADRALGPGDAKVTVQEFFSLTCSHCAAFQRDTFPRVKAELIDTGRIRYVFRDFPLDQVALTAAMVARSLPADRYEPFVSALLSSQDRWAFTRTANPTDELAKMAALAGLSRQAFNAAISDDGLRRAILAVQAEGEKRYRVDSTPTFIFNGRSKSGAISYDEFLKAVEAAA